VRWSFHIGTIAGIRVELHVTFLLFLVWAALSQGLLTGNVVAALSGVTLLLSVFGCVLLHELGHALAARRYGIRTRDIVLLPIGGVARLQRMPDRPSQEVVVALAGPAVNVVIAAVLALILVQFPAPNPLVGEVLQALLQVNLLMLGFNLIPAFPMDGGRVLRALLAMRMSYVRATRIAAGIGQGIALLFAVVGFGVFHNPMLIFVGLFVFLMAGEEQALVRARATMTGFPVRSAMITEFDTLDVAEPLQRAVDLLMSGSQQDFPVMENGAPIGILSRADLIAALKTLGAQAQVGEAIQRETQMADPGEPLEDVFQRMRERHRTALPVVSAGHLVGMVTTENVGELLLVQDALRRRAGR
jgi:Zn-dependent protease/predicted transcriptional regulator